MFGSLLYDRETRFLSGTFGGRLEFPAAGTNVFFSIDQATLANDGSVRLNASTRTPLPFGRVSLGAELQLTSTRAGGLDVLGHGQLAVPFDATTRLFDVEVLYDQVREPLALTRPPAISTSGSPTTSSSSTRDSVSTSVSRRPAAGSRRSGRRGCSPGAGRCRRR